jgi:hypothetical protein
MAFTLGRTTLAALCLAAVMEAVLRAAPSVVSTARLGGALAVLLLATCAGAAVYLLMCRLLGVRELRLLRWRRGEAA